MKGGFLQRRKSDRADSRLEIHYRIPGEEKFTRSETLGISENGIKFSTCREFSRGEILEFKLRLPGVFSSSGFVNFRGKVVWSKRIDTSERYEIGIAITEITEADRKQLRAKADSSRLPFA